jgi:hypothetical protein
MASVDSLPGSILLSDLCGLSLRRECHWRLHWIGRLWGSRRAILTWDPELVKLHRALILCGMRNSWFTIGMLGSGNTGGPAHQHDNDFAEGFARPMLAAYVYWLPEIVSLVKQYTVGLSVAIRPFVLKNGTYTLPLWNYVLYLAEVIGLTSSWNELRTKITEIYGENLIRGLLEEGVIESKDGRFSLCG